MDQKCNLKEASTNNCSLSLEATKSAAYDVFLSFKGNIRNGFVSHLYERLKNVGFNVFKDDAELDEGDIILEQLKMAINNSRICIPIFSKDYASSKACLRELSHMVLEGNGKHIFPIFYDVQAADVELKTDLYKSALKAYEGKVGQEELQKWEKALLEVSTILAYNIVGKNEANEITAITRDVLNLLRPRYQNHTNDLVGIDNQVEHVIKLLQLNTDGCRIIGLCGMGGIGKTTLATVVFNRLLSNFNNCCTFIANVRERVQNNELVKLLQQLYKDLIDANHSDAIDNINSGINKIKMGLHNKKFLLVLDDMDETHKLENFVGDLSRLSNGSRIIITTRDVRVLEAIEKDLIRRMDNGRALIDIYRVQELDDDRALQLFSRYAFQMDSPPEKFKSLSKEFIFSLGGLPLAIEVNGSYLRGREDRAWKDSMKMLKKTPYGKIQTSLMRSYNELTEEERQIFLDIACCPGSLEKKGAYYMWQDHWYPDLSIENLVNRSLVKVLIGVEFSCEFEYLWMHDVLKDLGRNIIQEERKSYGREVKRFLRIGKDIGKIPNEERKYVEMLQIDFLTITREDLLGFENVRFLRLRAYEIIGDFKRLLPNLRWICMTDVKHIMVTNFAAENLVVLQLKFPHDGVINGHWWNQMKAHNKLKVLEISGCSKMERTPSFREFLGLEVLILGWSRHLVEIDSSIEELKKLTHLDMRRCDSLAYLPPVIGNAKALEEILLKGCNQKFEFPCSVGNLKNLSRLRLMSLKMEELPASIGNLLSLRELDLSTTDISVLPDAVGQLKELRVLRMNNCRIRKFPTIIGRLRKLEELEAQRCMKFEGDITSEISELSSLRILNLRGTPVCRLPKFPSSLTHLFINSGIAQIEIHSDVLLELINVIELELCCECGDNPFNIPYGQVDHKRLDFQCIWRLSMLEKLHLCIPYVITGLQILNGLPCLKELKLSFAILQDHLLLPSTLSLLTLDRCKFPHGTLDVSHAKKLTELKIFGGDNLCEIRGLSELDSLMKLTLEGCNQLKEISDVSKLKSLSSLELSECGQLVSLRFDELEFLKILHIENLRSLSSLIVWGCKNLQAITGFDGLESLTYLSIRDCPSFCKFPEFSNSRSLSSLAILSIRNVGLESLILRKCGKLEIIEVLDGVNFLTNISIFACPSLEVFACLSNMRSLSSLDLCDCVKLKSIVGFDGLESLTRLSIRDCSSIETFPWSNMRSLSSLELWNCVKLKSIVGFNGLESLTKLSIRGCSSIENFHCWSNMRSLSSLELWDCVKLKSITVEFDGLESLTKLSIRGCPSIENFPYWSNMRSLSSLELRDCKNLKGKLRFDGLESLMRLSIVSIEIDSLELVACPKLNCINLLDFVGFDGHGLESLTELSIDRCPSLTSLPYLPMSGSLKHLSLSYCEGLISIELYGLKSLTELHIECCPSLTELHIECCPSLTELWIFRCPSLRSLPLSKLGSLKHLSLSYCEGLVLIALKGLESLTELCIFRCTSLRGLPHLSKLGSLKHLSLFYCEGLESIVGLTRLESLEKVRIIECDSLELNPNDLIKLLKDTRSVYITDCSKLSTITKDDASDLNEVKHWPRKYLSHSTCHDWAI